MNNNFAEAPVVQPKTSQEEDVIQMILADRKSIEKQETNSGATTIITGDTFFLDNNPLGVMKKETFKYLTQILPESRLHELQLFLQRLNEGESIDFKSVAYGNGEIRNFYAKIRRRRGNEEYTLPAVDNFMIFLIFYMNGKVSCQFTMKELYSVVKD